MIEASSVVTAETMIPLGIATVSALAIVGTVWRVATKLTLIDTRLAKIEEDLQDHWTYADQLSWIMDLREQNPDLTIPRPERKAKPHRSEDKQE